MDKDPAEIVATLRRSIEASQRGSRRLRAHRFKDLFGFQAWSPARREMVGKLLSDEGIVVQPSLEQAGRDDWLMFSIPTPGVTTGAVPEPRPTAEWFGYLAGLRLESEREVEMHFVSPLFEQLAYTQEQEAAGFGFVMWEGVQQHRAEADLLYFAGDVHDIEKGDPLVLVECKAVGKGPDAGLGQARSYAFWLQAGLLRRHRRRLPDRVELPGRRRTGRAGLRGPARLAQREVRRPVCGTEPTRSAGNPAAEDRAIDRSSIDPT